MDEWNALSQTNDAHAQMVHAQALLECCKGWRFELDHVEEGLVIMLLDVGDGLLGRCCVSGRLAVIWDLVTRDRIAGHARKSVVTKIAGQPEPNQVGRQQEPGSLH